MNFFKELVILLILFSLFACNPSEEKVVSFDDLSSGSKKDYDKDSNSIENQGIYADSLSELSQTLIDSLAFERKLISPLDSVFFSDRFGAKKTEKWVYKTDKDSLVFFHWEFKDSLKTQNTLYNWLDCYGPKCKSFMIGQENVSFSKRATLFLLQDKHLFFVESKHKIDYERILEVLDNSKWNKKWAHVVYQDPKKKAQWMKRDKEGELLDLLGTPIKKL